MVTKRKKRQKEAFAAFISQSVFVCDVCLLKLSEWSRVLKPWSVTPAEQSQWFPSTSMRLHCSEACCLISDPLILLLSTVHIRIVSTTTDALLSALPPPSCVFLHYASLISFSPSVFLSNSNSVSFSHCQRDDWQLWAFTSLHHNFPPLYNC